MNGFHVHLVGKENVGLGTTFAAVCERLDATPRLHLELDGSFVWSGDGWQLDGMIYDRDEHLQYVDLKGNCSREDWILLTHILIADSGTAAVVLLPEGGLYDLQDFEKLTWPQR